ncbi:MAG: twin-arginine translocation signal domain-containing protein, partial [Candidatus Aminicenantes bacterium]|nr:twin-arginine translocation signal domain-containing protein [Candidatus Aminicenantes bacterium]
MKLKKACSRREFLGKTLAGVAGAGLLGLNRLESGQKSAPATAATAETATLITRTLGKTGMRMPIVSMGVMNADLPALVQ